MLFSRWNWTILLVCAGVVNICFQWITIKQASHQVRAYAIMPCPYRNISSPSQKYTVKTVQCFFEQRGWIAFHYEHTSSGSKLDHSISTEQRRHLRCSNERYLIVAHAMLTPTNVVYQALRWWYSGKRILQCNARTPRDAATNSFQRSPLELPYVTG